MLSQVRFTGSKEGLPVTSVRELTILQQAKHPNIVSLLKVATGTRPDRYVGTDRLSSWPDRCADANNMSSWVDTALTGMEHTGHQWQLMLMAVHM